MDKLKITHRLYISTAAFVLLIAVLTYFFLQSAQSNVDFAQQEKRGDDYQRPLTEILKKLADYQIIGLQDNPAALSRKADEIGADFAVLKSVDAQLGAALDFTSEGLAKRQRSHLNLQAVAAKWQSLSAMAGSLDSRTFTTKTREVIADIRGMITHMGDTSNLILDPDLNSYYLMDVTLLALPQTLDRLGTIGNHVYGMLEKGALTEEDKVDIQRLASLLKESDIDRVTGDFSTSFNEDKNIRGGSPTLKANIEPKMKEYQQANETLVTLMQSIGKSMRNVTPSEWSKAVGQALSTSMALWTSSVDELDVLLASRISAFEQHILMVLGFVLVGLAASVAFFYFVIRSISGPLHDVQYAMTEIAHGKLLHPVLHMEKHDEIGDMAKSLQVFKENAQKMAQMAEEQKKQQQRNEEEKRKAMQDMANSFESSVKNVVDMVASAATQMDATSRSVAKIAENNQTKLLTLTEQIGGTTRNVQTVASSTTQLSAAIHEINKQVSRATSITAIAVGEAQKTDITVQGLSEAAQKIGEVVEMINSIAAQINLLALNATIEAARAGDAGKGFAVVASEVKSLATQTTKATEQIGQYISSIQGATTDTVSAMKNIGSKIREINEISTTIAAAVEEQGVATKDIASNVQQAAQGTESVSKNAAEVSTTSKETGESANQMMAATSELSRQSEVLRQEVDKFLAGVRQR